MGIARKLEVVGYDMDSMTTQEDLVAFLGDPENARALNGLVEDIRYALMDYQVCIPGGLALIIPNIRLRLLYNRTFTMRTVSRS